jgi:serine protease Do
MRRVAASLFGARRALVGKDLIAGMLEMVTHRSTLVQQALRQVLVGCMLLFGVIPAVAQTGGNTRVWKSADGKYTVQAAIVELEGTAVKLRKADGQVISVTVDQLSEADQRYIESWTKLREDAQSAKSAVGFSSDVLGQTTDLLKLIDTRRDTLKGSWAMDRETLVTKGEGRSVLQVRQALPEQYQLKFTVERTRGERGLNIAIVVGGEPVMIVLDAWKGSSTGLTMIDEKNEQKNVTLFRNKVLSTRPSDIVCTVHRYHVHVSCDGKTLFEWFGDPSQLSLFQRYWSDIPTDRLVLGTWGSDFRFTKLTLIPIQQSAFDGLVVAKGARDPGQSVALIEHPLGTGSGFVATRNVVVTNHHVIDSAYVDDLEIHFPDEDDPVPVRKVLFEDPARDLAVLLVETNRVPLPVAYDGEYAEGDEIVVHGNPSVGGGIVLRNASVKGKITATVRIDGQDFFQVEATVNPGSSGGPILNGLGQVVGVTAMKATEEGERMIREGMRQLDDSFRASSQQEGVAFGIPGSDLVESLETVLAQPALEAEKATVMHDTRVVFRRLVALTRLRMLKALAEVSDGMRRQAALAQSSGRTDGAIELLPQSLSRQIRAEMQGEQVAAMFLLYGKDLEQRIESIQGRADVPDSTKRHLVDLEKHAKSTERFATRPPTSYRTFSKKFLSLQDDFSELLVRLRDDGL